MRERFADFGFERPVPFLQFRKMRLQGHVWGSPSPDRHLTFIVCHGWAPPSHHKSIVQRSNSCQFVTKPPLRLKPDGQNRILERANAAGFPARGAARAAEV